MTWLDVTDNSAVNNAEENPKILFGVFMSKFLFQNDREVCRKNREGELDEAIATIG